MPNFVKMQNNIDKMTFKYVKSIKDVENTLKNVFLKLTLLFVLVFCVLGFLSLNCKK